MLRSLVTYSYIIGYIPTKMRTLKKLKAMKSQYTVAEYDRLVNITPKHWAGQILKKAGVTYSVTGLDLLPNEPVLLVSNHEGNFDIPVLIAALPTPFGFLSKVEVKKIPFISDWMTEMNCVFLDRSNRKSAVQSITDSVESLQNGHSLLLFPEGTRSKGNGVSAFKTGFVRIAERANVSIIPIAIYGTAQIMEQNHEKIRSAHVKIRVLAPVRLMETETNDEFVKRVEGIVHQAVKELEGESS